MTTSTTTQYTAADYIPMSVWGDDHNRTIGYVETVMVERGGFQVGSDPRMRSTRRSLRVLGQGCRHPSRPCGRAPDECFAPTSGGKYPTGLNNGQIVLDHDDWSCIQGAAAEGLFTVGPEGVQPGAVLHLSDKGRQFTNALRAHKAAGGSFATFVFSEAVPA